MTPQETIDYIEKQKKQADKQEATNIVDEKSASLTLANLGTKITNEIRDQMKKQIRFGNLAPNAGIFGPILGPSEFKTGGQYDLTEYLAITGQVQKESAMGAILSLIDKEGLIDTSIYDEALKDDDEDGEEGPTTSMSLMMGRCPVLNPPWQFGELDDVRSNRSYPLLGRVYLNYIYSNYPIVCFEPGRQKYSLLPSDFIGFSPLGNHKALNNYIRSGGKYGIVEKLGHGILAIKNVLLAGLDFVVNWFKKEEDKFVKFIPAMPLFIRYTNELFREFAANMRLLDLSGEQKDNESNPASPEPREYIETHSHKAPAKDTATPDDYEDITDKNGEKIGEQLKADADRADSTGVDDPGNISEETSQTMGKGRWAAIKKGFDNWFQDTKSDLYRTARYGFSSYRGSIRFLNLLSMLPHSALKNDFLDQNRTYLPFMVQKNISVSESFQNNFADHPLKAQLDSKAEEAEGKKAGAGMSTMMDAIYGGGVQQFLQDPGAALQGLGAKVTTMLTSEVAANTTAMGMLMTGSGRALLPAIWSNSSYSRNYSLDFEFFSPSGDTVSIFENCFIQFIIFLTLANPLQTAKYLYTSPFVIRVYSKGLFSINMGVVESMEVTRGGEKNDRTIYGYPRSIKISLGLKDLAPTMMLSLGGAAFWRYKEANSGMNEYIATLTNLSIADRYSMSRKWSVMWAKIKNEWFDQTLNLDNIGFNFTQKFAGIKPLAIWSRGNMSVDNPLGVRNALIGNRSG